MRHDHCDERQHLNNPRDVATIKYELSIALVHSRVAAGKDGVRRQSEAATALWIGTYLILKRHLNYRGIVLEPA